MRTGIKMNPDLATLQGGQPFERHPEAAHQAVLFLHGYTGRPADYRYLANRVADADIAVSVPRLPGSGTDLSDLSRVHYRDWIRRSYDAWLDLKGRYSRVSIVGFSMGGLLALYLASQVRPERLVLLAPAIKTTNPVIPFTPILAPFSRWLPVIRNDWTPQDTDDSDTREHGRRYWTVRDVKSLAQFARLGSRAGRRISQVQAPVFLVLSKNDPTVPKTVGDILKTKLPHGIKKLLIVENCKHDIPQGADREKVADTVLKWLGNDRPD